MRYTCLNLIAENAQRLATMHPRPELWRHTSTVSHHISFRGPETHPCGLPQFTQQPDVIFFKFTSVEVIPHRSPFLKHFPNILLGRMVCFVSFTSRRIFAHNAPPLVCLAPFPLGPSNCRRHRLAKVTPKGSLANRGRH